MPGPDDKLILMITTGYTYSQGKNILPWRGFRTKNGHFQQKMNPALQGLTFKI